jgi:hypothetical protein
MGKRKPSEASGEKRQRWHPADVDDELVFAVCQRFIRGTKRSKKGVAVEISEWIKKEYKRDDINRERVYSLFWEAVRRGFLFLKPPCERFLAQRIADRFNLKCYAKDEDTIRVVNVRGREAHGAVAATGARLVLSLAKQLKSQGRSPVHIGLGAGVSSRRLAQCLGGLLRDDSECPPLVLHALSTGGFSVKHSIWDAPLTYFGLFENVLPAVEYVGLFCPSVVESEGYEAFKQKPGVARSFRLAREIDIVVTSFASADDDDGLLKMFLESVKGEGVDEYLRVLEEEDWVGEIQFRPYSATAPILTPRGLRAVTLFELSELVELAQTENKYIVLLSAPCFICEQTRVNALKPLLTQRKLAAWTHLVTDVKTARDLLL